MFGSRSRRHHITRRFAWDISPEDVSPELVVRLLNLLPSSVRAEVEDDDDYVRTEMRVDYWLLYRKILGKLNKYGLSP